MQTALQPPASFYSYLKEKGRQLTLTHGDLLWEPGEAVGDLYLIEEGLLRLMSVRAGGATTTVLAAGAGGMVGVHPLLGQVEAAVGAEAEFSCRLLHMPVAQVRAWYEAHSSTQLRDWFVGDLRRHLEGMYIRLELAAAPAPERLARTLLSVDAQGFLACAHRRLLADLANLTVETVVRTLKTWEQTGTLTSRQLSTLTEGERRALSDLLDLETPLTLPYS